MNRQLLLNNVLNNPDNDALRLSFADWLEKQNAEQDVLLGNFIRLQLSSPERSQNEMIVVHYGEPKLVSFPTGTYTLQCPPWAQSVAYHRGFVRTVSCNWESIDPIWMRNQPITELNILNVPKTHASIKKNETNSWVLEMLVSRGAQRWARALRFNNRSELFADIRLEVASMMVRFLKDAENQ